MDLADIKARALAAREFAEPIGGRSFTVRVPTQHETLIVARRFGPSNGEDMAGLLLMQRALVEEAVVGWQGVMVGDVLPGAPEAAEALPHSREAVPVLLDAQDGWATALSRALSARIAARNAAIGAEQKN